MKPSVFVSCLSCLLLFGLHLCVATIDIAFTLACTLAGTCVAPAASSVDCGSHNEESILIAHASLNYE